jgi:hypothetical protein
MEVITAFLVGGHGSRLGIKIVMRRLIMMGMFPDGLQNHESPWGYDEA